MHHQSKVLTLLLILLPTSPPFLMVKVVLCTDRAVFFAAFHHAKAEEKEVDPLEVCVCVCVCARARARVCAYVSLYEHGLSVSGTLSTCHTDF